MTSSKIDSARILQKRKIIIFTDFSDIDQQWLSTIKNALNQAKLSIVDVIKFGEDPCSAIEKFHAELLVLIANRIQITTMQTLMVQINRISTPILIFEKQESLNHAAALSKTLSCTYLGGNVNLERLPSIISSADSRYESSSRLTNQLEKTRQQLTDRKDIERAKGILMSLRQLDENTAYSYLRSLAMSKGKTIGKVSRLLINSEQNT